MSELSILLAGIDKIRLRQARAIARAADRQRAGAAEGQSSDDASYEFAVAVIAAAADRTPAEIEELDGTILELGQGAQQIMALAGFVAAGEARPATSPSSADSSGSMAASLPATVISRRRSAK